MNKNVEEAILHKVATEPYAKILGLKLVKLELGYALVEMVYERNMTNIYDIIHGGAVFSLIDEAFEISCATYGKVTFALSMTVSYHSSPPEGSVLRAESKEIDRSEKTPTYDIKVTDGDSNLIASCLAMAYRKKEKLPFL